MASINDIKRMCKGYSDCDDCPLRMGNCIPGSLPDNVEEIVDKWVAEHSTKTYAMDFFSKFPDAPCRVSTGIPVPCIPVPCIRLIYQEFYNQNCSGKCSECWNREMKKDN